MLFEIFKVGVELFNQVNEARRTPSGLEGDMLLFFRYLKNAVDSKNTKRLEKLISITYRSQTFTGSDKAKLIAYFQSIFNSLPPFIYPSLEIEICKIPEVKEQSVSLVIRANLSLHIIGISLFSKLFGARERIAIVLKKDAKFGLFSVSSMEAVDGE